MTVAEQMLSSPTDAGYLFYGLILIALIVKVRPWRQLGAMLAAIVALRLRGARRSSARSRTGAIAGHPGSAGWIGSALTPLRDRARRTR